MLAAEPDKSVDAPADLGLAKQLAILGSQPGTSNVQHQ